MDMLKHVSVFDMNKWLFAEFYQLFLSSGEKCGTCKSQETS